MKIFLSVFSELFLFIMDETHFAKRKAFIVGVGMTKFYKCGQEDPNYIELGSLAARRALNDANIKYNEVQQAYVGYVYNESCAGQRVLYDIGMTGIPIINVTSNCSSGSTAFNLAYNSIKSGVVDCAMALGMEKLAPGPLKMFIQNKTHPGHRHAIPLIENGKFNYDPKSSSILQIFAIGGLEYMNQNNISNETIAKISSKSYKHGSNNPYALLNKNYTCDQILNSKMAYYPLTLYECCPGADGGACVIVCSEAFIKKHKLENQAVEILSSILASDGESSYKNKNMIDMLGYSMVKEVTPKALKQANITIDDIDVVELHDCFSTNELMLYDALGLCKKENLKDFVDKGDNTYGGKYVVNPSGGLTSKGHPFGATGLGQLSELTWQLRGMAEKRQVDNAKCALQHNFGLGNNLVITVLKKYNTNYARRNDQTSDLLKLEAQEKDTLYVKYPRPKF